MWDFQYSRIRMRMRILHFNIRGYRMRILQILFQPQMMKKSQKIMRILN